MGDQAGVGDHEPVFEDPPSGIEGEPFEVQGARIVSLSVEARGIYKRYGGIFGPKKTVLENISLEIEAEEIFGLLGPNGSGKTTLISIFSTLIYPDEGRLKVLSMDSRQETDAIRKAINISTAKPNFPWSLTVAENLRYSGMLYGMEGQSLKRAIDDVIDAFELEEYRGSRFEDLSTGLKQRLSLAKAMLNSPRLLFLDEPTTGLDPEITIKTREIIRMIHEDRGVSIVLSTHYMPEAEMLCDRIAFIRAGRIVALDTPANLKSQLSLGERVTIKYEGPVDVLGLEALPGVMRVEASPGRVDLTVDRTAGGLGRIIKAFADADVKDINIDEPDLEDVFLELAR